jgi:ribosome-binding factor A
VSGNQTKRQRDHQADEGSSIRICHSDGRRGYRDLSYARVYVSVFGDDASAEETLAALKSGSGFFRSELGQRIRLRHTPEISFRLDKSAQRGARIDELLAELRQKEESDADD